MTKEQLAATLNGREYCSEIAEHEEEQVKAAGLVVVFGYSDDIMEMHGAIREAYGCYEGGDIIFTKKGREVIEYDMEVLEKYGLEIPLNKITAVWSPEDEQENIICSWMYKTDIPHATFDIMEDGELRCRGIVFSVDDLK